MNKKQVYKVQPLKIFNLKKSSVKGCVYCNSHSHNSNLCFLGSKYLKERNIMGDNITTANKSMFDYENRSISMSIKKKYVDFLESVYNLHFKFSLIRSKVYSDARIKTRNILMIASLTFLSKRDIFICFNPFGRIKKIKIINCKISKIGKYYYMIDFLLKKRADEALFILNDKIFKRSKITIIKH